MPREQTVQYLPLGLVPKLLALIDSINLNSERYHRVIAYLPFSIKLLCYLFACSDSSPKRTIGHFSMIIGLYRILFCLEYVCFLTIMPFTMLSLASHELTENVR